MFSGTLRENIDPFVRYSDAAVAKAVHDCGLQGRSLDAVVEVSSETSASEKSSWCVIAQPLHRIIIISSSRLCSLTLQFTQVCLARVLLQQPRSACTLRG